jgi:hypothetical protein
MSAGGQWEQGQPQDQQPQGQSPYGQVPPGQPYGPASYGQGSYGQPHGPAPYGQASSGQPYGQAPYGQPYGQQPYGQQPYGHQPYGPPSWGPAGQVPGWQQPGVWPHGQGRPGLATAAAVLAIVTGSLTALAGLAMLLSTLGGGADLPTWLLVLGLPVGGVLLTGGISLLGRRRADWVLWSSLAAVVVLVLALLAGALTLDSDGAIGLLFFTVFASVLPIVTASLSARGIVREWAAGEG